MAHSTVALFLARIDPRWISDLTSALDGSAPDSPASEPRIQAALDDATGELDGLLLRVPAGHRPGADTLRVHCHKVALYLLTLNRPGKEFEQIRNAYTDTMAFYQSLLDAAAAASAGGASPAESTAVIPDKVFTSDALRGF